MKKQKKPLLSRLSLIWVLGIAIGLLIIGALPKLFSPLHAEANDELELALEADTFIASRVSGTGNSAVLWLGNDTDTGFGNERILLRFTANGELLDEDVSIEAATLSLHQVAKQDAAATMAIALALAEGGWSEDVAWNNQPRALSNFVPGTIGANLDESYKVNVTELLKQWKTSPTSSINFIIKGNELPGEHERGFAAKDCQTDCKNPVPKLIIQFSRALTPTPSLTFTPSPTSTPTPGIASIRLRNEPPGELVGGQEVTYIIELQNGPFSLANVVVSNAIPEHMELAPNSIIAPSAWATAVENRMIRWVRSSLPVSETVTFAYRAQRHTPTITPTPTNTLPPTAPGTTTATPSPTATSTGLAETPAPTGLPTATATATPLPASTHLTITKSGPAVVSPGSAITYTVRVTNQLTHSLTGATIFDLIPLGAQVVNFGGGSITMPPSQMIQWQIPLLNPSSSVTRTFSIRLTRSVSQIRNELYFVDVSENGELILRAVGASPVVTNISPPLLLEYSNPLSADTPFDINPPIINEGAIIRWEYLGVTNQVISNPVRNPPFFQLYLPAISR